jgi:hypothetical protein
MSAVINAQLDQILLFSFRNLQTYMRLSKLRKLSPSAIGRCAMVLVPPLAIKNEEMEPFCQHHFAMANAGKTVIAQLTKVRSIHRGFYK